MTSGISSTEAFTTSAAGQVVQVDYDLTASAFDPDGDDITYVWSVVGPACQIPGSGFTDSVVHTPTLTLSQGPGQLATSTVHFVSGDLSAACILQLTVTDSWPGQIPPAGSALPLARGGSTVATLYGSPTPAVAFAPYIYLWSGPASPVPGSVTTNSATYAVAAGQSISLSVYAVDSTPSFNPTELPFTFTWTQNSGALAQSPSGLPGEVTVSSPTFSANTWTAPATVTDGTFVRVVVTNRDGLSTSFTWNIVPQ
jgi:hypothetical protein